MSSLTLSRMCPCGQGCIRHLSFAQKRRLDYLIVSSLDRLASNEDEAFEVAWCLGHAGTVPVPAYEDD